MFLLANENNKKSRGVFTSGLLALCILAAVGGCGKKDHDISGVWIPNNVPKGIQMSLELKSNGTWTQSIKDDKHTMSASGTYTTVKSSLDMTELKTAVDGVDKGSAKNYKYSYKVKWVSNDEVELTQLGNSTIYKRKQ